MTSKKKRTRIKMVCVPIMQKQKEHFDKNLGKYKKEHPGEWLVIDSSLKETFYKNEDEFEKALPPPFSFGANLYPKRIPFDRKKAEYNLEIQLKFNWDELEKAIGPFESAEIILKAKPYVGLFTVYNNGYLEKGLKNGLEKRVAVLRLTEPSNFEIINRKEKKPVHAHFEGNGKAIDYTPKQIIPYSTLIKKAFKS